MAKANVEIKYLKDYPQYLSNCAQWSFETWVHYTPSRPLEDFILARQAYLNYNILPLTLIALDPQQKPVGMCSLTSTRGLLPQLTPWLAALYVVPAARNKGVGQLLEEATCQKASNLGFSQIYCFTSDSLIIPWYQKRNWQIMCTEQIHKHSATILVKKLV